MNIIKFGETKNPLFDRREIKVRVEADVVPSRLEAIKVISDQFKCSQDCIHLLRISSNFGTKTFTLVAHIYNSKEDKDKNAVKKKKDIELEKKQAEEKNKEEDNTPKEEENKTEEKTE